MPLPRFLSARTLAPLLGLAALAALGPVQAAPTVIDTTGSWNHATQAITFGNPNTATYGQTITAPGANVLTDFTFYFQPFYGTAPAFQAYVAAWNGTAITGPLLYTSGVVTGPTAAGFTPYTFKTGGVTLVTGQQYALFVSTSNEYKAATQLDGLGAITTNPYAGGAYIYKNNRGNFASLYSAWDQKGNNGLYGNGYDLAFTADFSPAPAAPAASTPEPSSWAAFAFTALGALGLMGRARKRAARATA